MALQQSYGSEGDASGKQVWNPTIPIPQLPDRSNGCFDCNICLDSSQDPVVTLCGHLYCWPCIYKWLRVQTSSFGSENPSKCPVCKAHISTTSLVPLYGRGASDRAESKKAHLNLTVPERPPALRTNALSSQQNHQVPFRAQSRGFQQHQQQQQYMPHSLGGYTSSAGFYSPTINMVGEFVFARMFGSSDTNAFAYPYSNYYHSFSGNGSPRLRRQEMQLDKSLNRVSMFLFCCLILCLVLF